MGKSGSESFSLGYSVSAVLASGTSAWVQSGSGSAAGNSKYDSWYSGSASASSESESASGSLITDDSNAASNVSDHGSFSGTSNYSDAMTLGSNGGWTHQSSFASASRDEAAYGYNGSYSDETMNGFGSSSWSASINDDEITNTTSNQNDNGSAANHVRRQRPGERIWQYQRRGLLVATHGQRFVVAGRGRHEGFRNREQLHHNCRWNGVSPL